MSNIVRCAQATQRNLGQNGRSLSLVQGTRHIGLDKACGNAIDRDIAATQRSGQGPRHARTACLGGRLVGLDGIAAGDDDRSSIAMAAPRGFLLALGYRTTPSNVSWGKRG